MPASAAAVGFLLTSTTACAALQIRFKSSKFEIRHDEVQQLEVELGALAAPGEG